MPETSYFSGFVDALDPVEAEAPAPRLADPGAERLPFDLLDDRRFEVLAYRLKCAEFGTDARPTLMQGVKDRGRDVIVYSSQGKVVQIVQCKRLLTRMTAPALRQELLKVAIHAFLQPEILGQGPVSYELWCPGGLTEPAAEVFSRWPTLWTEAALKSDAEEVIGEYAGFKSVVWADAKDFVTTTFRDVIRPVQRHGVDLAIKVRACPDIYAAFFQTNVVVGLGEAEAAFRKIMAEMTQMTDKDAKHLVDRVTSFRSDQRLMMLSAFVLGLSPQLVGRFEPNEFEEFVTHAIQATTGIMKTVTAACTRLAGEAAKDFRESARPTNSAITHFFSQTLTTSMLARITAMMPAGKKMQPKLAEWAQLPFSERLGWNTREMWDSYQRCLAGYDPKKHRPGSDPEFRFRIAKKALDGATTFEQFDENLKIAKEKHVSELERRHDAYMALVPEQILVVTDTLTALDSKALMDRMVETMGVLQVMRKGGSVRNE
jgi:hypothetical protein